MKISYAVGAGLFIYFLSFSPSIANEQSEIIERANVRLEYRDITSELASSLVNRAQKAYKDLSQFLGIKYPSKVQFSVKEEDDFRFVGVKRENYKKVIKSRNEMPKSARTSLNPHIIYIPARMIYTPGRTATVHEMVHFLLGTPQPVEIGGRLVNSTLLVEGIAVFLDNKFSMEDEKIKHIDLHLEGKTILKSPFANKFDVKGTYLHPYSRNEGLGIIYSRVGGSFVKFLVDNHGIEKFLSVYRGKSFSKIYGKSIDQLNNDWKDFLAQYGG